MPGGEDRAGACGGILLGAIGLPTIRHADATEISPHLRLRERFQLYAGTRPAKAYPNLQRLLIYETGIHFIDLFRFLLGPFRSIQADIRRLNPAIRGEDAGFLLMGHRAGPQSLLDGNRLLGHATDDPRRTMGEMLVEGREGSLRLGGYGQVFLRRDAAETEERLLGPNDDPEFGDGCVEALCRHVVRHLLDGAPLENAAGDDLPVLDPCEAAYRSARSGRRIEIPEGKG